MSKPYSQKMRLIFMGTPEFAAPGLNRLLEAPEFEIIGVFTQPDRPIGRQQLLTPPPIKKIALAHNIAVFQPEKIRLEIANIKKLKPDLIVVIAYGKIIPQEILDIPTLGCVNVHASLLPKYRGAACLNAPILNGDQETGITIMKMDAGLDTGPILRQAKIKLNGKETLEKLHDRLSELGAKLLIPTLLDLGAGKIKPQIQDNSRASYIKILKKEDGQINWQKSAIEIERMIRAYNPWPGSYSLIGTDKKIFKILSAGEIIKTNKHQVGELFLQDEKLSVQCGQDSLVILKLQLAGKQATTAPEFIRGYQNLIGHIFQ